MGQLFEITFNEVARLILVRHGRTNHNVLGRVQGITDAPLDEVGLEQAERTGRALAAFGVDVLYTSPLARACETAELIGKHVGLTPRLHPDLTEFDFGVISSRTIEDMAIDQPALYGQLVEWLSVGWNAPQLRPRIPGAEDEQAFQARLLAFWADVQARHTGQMTVAVTHGGVIKGMFSLLTGADLRRHMPFWADNCSMSVIDFHRGAANARSFNDCGHLGDLREPLGFGKHLVL